MSGGENPRLTAAPIGSIFISRLRRGDGLGMLVSTHVFAATVVNAVDDRHGLRAGGGDGQLPDHLASVGRQGQRGFSLSEHLAILPDLPGQAAILAGCPGIVNRPQAHRRRASLTPAGGHRLDGRQDRLIGALQGIVTGLRLAQIIHHPQLMEGHVSTNIKWNRAVTG